MIEGAFETARTLGIQRLLVQADRASDVRNVERLRESERILWLTRGNTNSKPARGDHNIQLPEAQLSRASQLSMALFLAALTTDLRVEDSVLCLSGSGGGGSVDTITLTKPVRRFPWLLESDLEATRHLVSTPTFPRVLSLALRLAAEGREGGPVGTVFVIADPEELQPYVQQLILNPCEGHPRKLRNVHNPLLFETIRELVAMDGALLVSPKGVLEAAGTYLAPQERPRVRRGLGSRHAAAAGISAQVTSLAVVVSQSSGTVTAYRGGRAVLSLERPTLTGSSVRVRRR